MKLKLLLGWSSALCLSAGALQAQETNANDKVSQQLKEMQEKFDKQTREMREAFDKIVRDQQAQIDTLKKQVEPGQKALPPTAGATQTTTNVSPQEMEELRRRVDDLTTASKKSFISQFNPGIGFVGDTIFSYTSKGMEKTGSERPGGFDVFFRTAELNLEATVDPFARAYGVISASADPVSGEADLGVEEAALITTSLPWNLTAQAGRFFADFGRLSYVHDHDLPFVYRPLVLDSYIGGESRTDGIQLNYLFPTAHYISLTLGVGNSFGGDTGPNAVGGFRSVNELNYWGHLSTYFDLTANLNLELGASGLMDDRAEGRGDFSGPEVTERRRRIGAADITLRYQPLGSSIHRGLVWGTEVLYNSGGFDMDPDGVPGNGDEFRNYENSVGLYSYVEAKLSRSFKAGFLFDWAQDAVNSHNETFRYSPYITWNPSEFQFIRLQYSHTDPSAGTGLSSYDAIYLEWQFIIGRHVHGFKQR